MTNDANDIITTGEELDAIAERHGAASTGPWPPKDYVAYHGKSCERSRKGTFNSTPDDCSCGLDTDIPRLIDTIRRYRAVIEECGLDGAFTMTQQSRPSRERIAEIRQTLDHRPRTPAGEGHFSLDRTLTNMLHDLLAEIDARGEDVRALLGALPTSTRCWACGERGLYDYSERVQSIAAHYDDDANTGGDDAKV